MFGPAVDLTAVVSTALVIGVGATRVLDGKLSVGQLLVFVSYIGSMYKPVKALAKLSHTFSKGLASVERIRDIREAGVTAAGRLDEKITQRGEISTSTRHAPNLHVMHALVLIHLTDFATADERGHSLTNLAGG